MTIHRERLLDLLDNEVQEVGGERGMFVCASKLCTQFSLVAPPLKRATEKPSTPESAYKWQNAGTAAILPGLTEASNSCGAAEKSSTCLSIQPNTPKHVL